MNLINRKMIYLFAGVVFLTGTGSLIATIAPTEHPTNLDPLEHGPAGSSAVNNHFAETNPSTSTYPPETPDFVNFPIGGPRKAAFYNYFYPIIERENRRILSIRNKILNFFSSL